MTFETEGYRLPDTVVDEMVQERIRERSATASR